MAMAKPANLPPLDLGDAFVHVINEHRWLAASACSWKLVGPKARTRLKLEAHELIPNIDVMALDSVLLHARALINFYTNHGGPTDILLKNFDRAVDSSTETDLAQLRRPIEVHLLHLTSWRDISFRLAYSADFTTYRYDWNRETTRMVALLHKALRSASNPPGDWKTPFKELYDASRARLANKLSLWPKHLGEKPDILRYLDSLNL
jgi:hypothetical protein